MNYTMVIELQEQRIKRLETALRGCCEAIADVPLVWDVQLDCLKDKHLAKLVEAYVHARRVLPAGVVFPEKISGSLFLSGLTLGADNLGSSKTK